MNNNVIRELAPAAAARLDAGKCPGCGCDEPESTLRDLADEREYAISGLCATCQDGVFGAPDDDLARDDA